MGVGGEGVAEVGGRGPVEGGEAYSQVQGPKESECSHLPFLAIFYCISPMLSSLPKNNDS